MDQLFASAVQPLSKRRVFSSRAILSSALKGENKVKIIRTNDYCKTIVIVAQLCYNYEKERS